MGDQSDAFLAKFFNEKWPSSTATQSKWRYDHLADIPEGSVICLQDRILPPTAQEVFARRLHAHQVVRIDAGHQAQNTRPHGLAKILLAAGAA